MKKLIRLHALSTLLLWLWFAFVAGPTQLFAQQPSNLPPADTEPVDFFESVTNIIVFIILPLIAVILFFVWRRKVDKMRKRKQDEKNDPGSDSPENI